MNIKHQQDNSIKADSRPSYKERILQKKSALTKTAATVAAVTTLTVLSQQAEAALVAHSYNQMLDESDSVNPLTGDLLDSSSGAADLFNLSSSFGLFFGSNSNGSVANALATEGTDIGPSPDFIASIFINSPDYTLGTNQFIGFQLNNQGIADDETWFGYLEFSATSSSNVTLVQTVVQNDGSAITVVSAVPEPSTSILGGLAFTLALGLRRRSKS